ncbi:hypothetical protein ACVIN2_002550 [Bradyrhizobium sp. USDA 3650]
MMTFPRTACFAFTVGRRNCGCICCHPENRDILRDSAKSIKPVALRALQVLKPVADI